MTVKLSNIVLFLFATAVMGSGIGYSSLYLFHLVFVFFIFSYFYILYSNKKQNTLQMPKSYFLSFLYVMFLWYLVSIVWSIEPEYTLMYLFYLFIGISIVFLVNSYVVDRNKFISAFNVVKLFSILALVIALLEAFTPFRLPTSPYSDYATLFGRKGIDFQEFESEIQMLIKSAPTAFWGNSNNLAVSMSIIFPFFIMHHKILVKLIGFFSTLVIIAMTGSRGTLIAFLFAIALYLFIKGVRYWLPVLIFFIVSIFVIANTIDSLKESENKRIADLAGTAEVLYSYLFEKEESMNSIGSRQQLIENGMTALWSTNGLGVGGGGSTAVQERQGGVAGKLLSMHNFWIELLVDSGVVFFTFFMIWYLILVIKLYVIYLRCRDSFYHYYSGSFLIAMVSFTISAISASSVIYLLPMWLMFGFSIALVSLYRKENSYENSIAGRG